MSKNSRKVRAKKSKKDKNKQKNAFYLRKKKLLSKIEKWDSPILKVICDDIREEENVSNIIKELKSILILSETGIGLSACQIGYAKKIFAIMPNPLARNIEIFINADIIEKSEETSLEKEGCLSYPGIFAPIERYEKITVNFFDENMESHTNSYEGIIARIIQHEYDHTMGICLVGDFYYASQEQNIPKEF